MRKTTMSLMLAGMMAFSGISAMNCLAQEEPVTENTEDGFSSFFGALGSALSENSDKINELLTGEEGLVNSLFGEEGPLNEYIPEGLDVNELASQVMQQVTDLSGNFSETAENLIGMVTNEDGSVNEDMIRELTESLLSSFGIGGTEGDATQIAIITDEERDAVIARVEEDNAPYLEAGDITLTFPNIAEFQRLEDGTSKVFGYFMEVNYDLQDSDMVMKNASSCIGLYTLSAGEDGSVVVSDAKLATDGEGQDEDVAAFCEELGIETEQFYNAMSSRDVFEISALMEYLNDHENVKRAEFMGELMSYEQLEELLGQAVETMLSTVFEEDGIEEVTEVTIAD